MACSGCAKRKAALLAAGRGVARVVRRVIGRPAVKPRPVEKPKA